MSALASALVSFNQQSFFLASETRKAKEKTQQDCNEKDVRLKIKCICVSR